MKIKNLFGLFTIIFLLSAGSMCAAPGRVYVRVGPPAPKHVVVVHKTRPHKDAIWVSGHWNWNGHKYVWVDGHWLAPRHGYTWVPGHWQQNRHGWFWVDGHWKRV